MAYKTVMSSGTKTGVFRPKTPVIDMENLDNVHEDYRAVSDWRSEIGETYERMAKTEKRMAKKRECIEKITKFKESTAYKTVLNAGILRPKTPDISMTNFNPAWEDYNAISDWKNGIDEAFRNKQRFLKERQQRDVSAMKDTLLYMEYAKWLHFEKVKLIETPDLNEVYTLKDWEAKFDKWKFELKDAVDEYHKERKKADSASYFGASIKNSSAENSAETEAKVKASINFKHMLSLDANDLMTYIQEKSQHYSEKVDKMYPDGRSFIGSIVGGCIRYVPCGSYNKDNSCTLPFVHNDEKGEKRIHACALCYFVMGGMINVHRLIQCPLLAT